ncbi:hypothetical protein AAG570_002041 [Ranatra chinensis]|uniref:Translationally-controlled tumor protein homolog n=1 Tax=Ranatra chinensis TaxID=642074 RepID=A0ABD0YA94_9HEMI
MVIGRNRFGPMNSEQYTMDHMTDELYTLKQISLKSNRDKTHTCTDVRQFSKPKERSDKENEVVAKKNKSCATVAEPSANFGVRDVTLVLPLLAFQSLPSPRVEDYIPGYSGRETEGSWRKPDGSRYPRKLIKTASLNMAISRNWFNKLRARGDSPSSNLDDTGYRRGRETIPTLSFRFAQQGEVCVSVLGFSLNLSLSSTMRIYKDIFTGDEMFSDSYKMKLVDNVLYEVYAKLITRKHGDIQLDGANPSAEEAGEGTDEAVESGVDVVLNHRLCETFAFGDKKSYTAYLKDYMKKLVGKLEEKSPDEVNTFKTNMNKVMKDLLGRFKELQFFTGESMDIDGMIALLEYREIENESVPVLMFFKHGLEEEKF